MIDLGKNIAAAARLADADASKRAAVQTGAEAKGAAAVAEARKNYLKPGERLKFERTYDFDDKLPIRYLELGALAARAVGRVYAPDPDIGGDATGFLVAPGLLLTNHHVLPTADHAAASTVTFQAEEDRFARMLAPLPVRLNPAEVYVSDETLDFALVAVEPRAMGGEPLDVLGYLPLFPGLGKITNTGCATVIHHPTGQPKQVTLRDNRVTIYKYDDPDHPDPANAFLYYQADTEPGSSGAPVFNDQWYVVALHRQAVARMGSVDGQTVILRKDGQPALATDRDEDIDWIANEGVRISRILAALEAIAAEDGARGAAAASGLARIRAAAGQPLAGAVPLAASRPLVSETAPPAAGGFELIRRSLEQFAGAKGHDVDFLGTPVPFPVLSAELERELAPGKQGEKILHYDHFSLQMHRVRRMPIYTVVDIDGALVKPNKPRPKWSYDPRMDEAFQPSDKLFTPGSSRRRAFDRGHMVRQLDPVWGATQEIADRAQEHTFCLTNVIPQEHGFNDKEWGDLEDHILSTAEGGGAKVVVFSGPIFISDDPFIADLLRGGPREDVPMPNVRVPRFFFKIVAWRDAADGDRFKAAGFLRDQAEEMSGPRPFEISFGGVKQKQQLISDIQDKTGLTFAGLVEADTLAAAGLNERVITRPEDAVL